MIRGIVELALRVNDLASMKSFYRDVVGLEVYADPEPYFVFFKVAEAVEGHPQILGLFDRKAPVEQDRSTLDHLAFLIDLVDYDMHAKRLRDNGVEVSPKTFPHFHWRSLFFRDPEGNTVELVCYDPTA